ncbi:MAG: FecR domain-containing protein, partial [Gammaproteobacteria bacterium]|nr:FecR domain-containing protein [Gammaproteobacteria bacterium]
MKMRVLSVFGGITTGMLIFLGARGMALAQEEPQGAQSQEQSQMLEQLGEDPDQASNPPGRVAQLSYAEGSVSLEPAGTGSWTSAALNRPLTLGDKLWTDQNSRAELDIGDAVIRLGSTTGISVLNLDDQTAQLQVTAGTVIVHVRTLSSGEQDEIDTPDLALTLQQPGTYRIEVSDSGDTTIVKVDDGEALATGGGQSYPVTAQQSVTFTGTSTLAADYATLGAPDALDDWSMQREQQTQQQASVAQQYVPPGMVGGDDLGTYGTWQSTPDWGYAWFPTVAVGWAPYSLGNWVWISPWGWTWVDREPWGFAPFHYGRWGYWHRRWCWIPGPQRRHPVYAPALVAWVGGPRAGASVAVGAHVGWFPLGPRDVYVPGYRVSQTYVRNINLTNSRLVNTTEIGNAYGRRVDNVRYANSEVPGAITAVPRNVFTSAQPVGPHRVVLPHEGGINFRANTAAPAIMPVRESVLGANAGTIVRTPPHAILDRPVVARLAPPRAPVSFAREQAAIRANGGRPVPMAELERMRPNTPAAPVRLASPPASARPGFEARTLPESRGAPAGANMSAREHVLQQPSLPPRSDRPAWVQGRPMQPGVSMERPHPGTIEQPQQRFAPEERQVPEQRFAAPQRQIPEQRFAPQERQVPEQRFTAPQ